MSTYEELTRNAYTGHSTLQEIKTAYVQGYITEEQAEILAGILLDC